jgi:hypothetical protein
MRHDLTGCEYAALQAANLLDHLSDMPDIDGETRDLCEHMSQKLTASQRGGEP